MGLAARAVVDFVAVSVERASRFWRKRRRGGARGDFDLMVLVVEVIIAERVLRVSAEGEVVFKDFDETLRCEEM